MVGNLELDLHHAHSLGEVTLALVPLARTVEIGRQLDRDFGLFQTVKGITDEQASLPTTVSELSLGGLIKHVTAVEDWWANSIVQGAGSMEPSESAYEAHAEGFRFDAGDSLASLLERYEEVAKRTDELVLSVPSLDASHPLPVRPWFRPGAAWSAGYVVLHILAETSQHAGHADIIREALDGSKTMG
jgi:hypothetical protein